MKEKVLEFLKSNAAVSLTLLSAYGYFCVYVYEYGYFKYFRVPANLIEVQINEVLVFVFSLALVGANIIFWLDKVLLINTSYNTPRLLTNLVIKTFGLGFIVFFLVLNVTSLSVSFYWIILSVIILCCFAYLFWEYLFIRKYRKFDISEENIVKQVRESLKENPSASTEEIIQDIKSKMLPEIKRSKKDKFKNSNNSLSIIVDWMVFAAILLLICFGLGYSEAARSRSFIAFKKHPTIFVIKKYGENMICKNFDFANKIFGDSILFYKISDTSNNILTERQIK